jgi:hypothetical protein
VAFRFAFAYFGIYAVASSLLTSIFVLPNASPGPGLGTVWPMRDITSWTGVHILGMTPPLAYSGNSRDTDFFWAQIFLVVSVAIASTIFWSFLDGRRDNYASLHKWFRVFVRFALAAQMIYFGMLKVIPTQFPAPSLLTLAAPVGNLSLQSLLWTSIGASTPYQIFTGIVELLGGLLLIAPRTTTLGAGICLAGTLQIFVLNMTYDVGVKILSFQLVLMSLFLLAPDFQRLMNVFITNRPAVASSEVELFRTPRGNRIALGLQIAFGLYLTVVYASIGHALWFIDGGGSPKSPLYGIWNVEELRVDGEARPAEFNDYDRRWRRVIFDTPPWIFFQRTDDSFARYGLRIDIQQRTLYLTKGHSQSWHSNWTFERPDADRLFLKGLMDGHEINAKLKLVPFDTLRLLNSHFRWMRPPDAETQ